MHIISSDHEFHDLLVLDVFCKVDIMMPLDQSCSIADVYPHSIRKAAYAFALQTGDLGLHLQLLEESLFVDLTVKFPKNFGALIVTVSGRLIACHLIEFCILLVRGIFYLIFFFQVDCFLDQGTRTVCLEVWTDLRKFRQFIEHDL